MYVYVCDQKDLIPREWGIFDFYRNNQRNSLEGGETGKEGIEKEIEAISSLS